MAWNQGKGQGGSYDDLMCKEVAKEASNYGEETKNDSLKEKEAKAGEGGEERGQEGAQEEGDTCCKRAGRRAVTVRVRQILPRGQAPLRDVHEVEGRQARREGRRRRGIRRWYLRGRRRIRGYRG